MAVEAIPTLEDRTYNYQATFPKYAKQASLNVDYLVCGSLASSHRWIYGTWIIGNQYGGKQERYYDTSDYYYGKYPYGYLDRILSLFYEIPEGQTLHIFCGKCKYGITVDIKEELEPDLCLDVNNLSKKLTYDKLPEKYFSANPYLDKSIPPKPEFSLILSDPYYSESDCLRCGTSMINRNRVVKECFQVLKPHGFLVWLDQVYPMYSRREFLLVGTIGLIQSTNHRVRMIFIYEKQEG